MNEQIIKQLEQVFKQDFELVSHNFADLERTVKEKMQLLGQGLLQRMVNLKPNGYQGSSIACKCGHSMKFVQHRSRDVQTTFGWIKIKRAYYYCSQCGKSLFPYDKASGIGSFNLSSALADACCLVATDDSFEQVSKKIEYLLGQKVELLFKGKKGTGLHQVNWKAKNRSSGIYFCRLDSESASDVKKLVLLK